MFIRFCERRDELQWYGGGVGYLISSNSDSVLCPDASLSRIRPEPPSPWLPFSPEIAVEVLSPSNTRSHISSKIRRYLAAGSEQVWIADPIKQELRIHFKDGREMTFGGDAEVQGEGIAAGMAIRLQEIFI